MIAASLLSSSRVTNSAAQKRAEFGERLRLFRTRLELPMSNAVEDLQILARSPALLREDVEAFAVASTLYEITELREAVCRRQVSLDEVNRRVKNTVATVHSTARLSAASARSVKEYLGGFEQRLHALSEAYNLLTQNTWEGADLKEIVERMLAPYAADDRVSIRGPAAMLPPKHSLALAAAIQELSTNAAKYGSLSAPTGKVAISWTLNEFGAIAFEWRESDGPAVTPPTRRGFRVEIDSGCPGSRFGLESKTRIPAPGVHCALTFDARR